jgi:hypothetical protein
MSDQSKGNRIITRTVTDDAGGTELFWARMDGDFELPYDGSLLLGKDGSSTFKCWTDCEIPVVVHIAGNRVIVAADESHPAAPENVLLDTATLTVIGRDEPGDITGRVRIVTVASAQALQSAHDALAVICLDEQSRGWLEANDPNALEQADTARRDLTAALGNGPGRKARDPLVAALSIDEANDLMIALSEVADRHGKRAVDAGGATADEHEQLERWRALQERIDHAGDWEAWDCVSQEAKTTFEAGERR